MRTGTAVLVVLTLTALAGPAVAAAQSTESPAAQSMEGPAAQSMEGPAPQVRGVFFYSPQCPHCHDVMRDHLPPLMRKYGEGLRIVAVNVDTPEGQALYRAVALHFRLPRQRLGVPALVVGDRVMVGSAEIPAQLPGLVEAGLAGDGVDWPDVAEVRSFLALQGIAAGASIELAPWMLAGGAAGSGGDVVQVLEAGGGGAISAVAGRFMSDPMANSIAVLVLLGMIGALGASAREVARPRRPLTEWPRWSVPALAAAGTGVALYLAYVEVTGVAAVCGPVGDCNRVQLSQYAYVAGVPIGVLGVGGYLLLGTLWAAARRAATEARRRQLGMLLWATAAGGVLFSIYLTFLEPFVIGATCIWCINSAIIMTLILGAATPSAVAARRDVSGIRAGRARGALLRA